MFVRAFLPSTDLPLTGATPTPAAMKSKGKTRHTSLRVGDRQVSTSTHDAVLNIRLPKSTLDALRQRQRETMVPTSAWVRSLIDEALRPVEKKAEQ